MPKTQQWQWYLERVGDGETHMHAIEKTFYSGATAFQLVGVVQSPVYGKMLILDGDTQSSQLDEFIYHESLVFPAAVLHGSPKTSIILGGGEGATARDLLACKTMQVVEMIDIDGEVVGLCEKYLPEWSQGAFGDKRCKLVVGDARKYITETPQKYDVIISDLTEPLPDSPSHNLFTKEFFEIIKSKLNDGGTFALQASTADVHNLELHTIIRNTLSKVFKYARSFISRVPAYDTLWAFVLCSDAKDPLELTENEVNSRISNLVGKPLRYYDGITHKHMFSLPKYLRTAVEKQTQVLQDDKTFELAATGVLF